MILTSNFYLLFDSANTLAELVDQDITGLPGYFELGDAFQLAAMSMFTSPTVNMCCAVMISGPLAWVVRACSLRLAIVFSFGCVMLLILAIVNFYLANNMHFNGRRETWSVLSDWMWLTLQMAPCLVPFAMMCHGLWRELINPGAKERKVQDNK
jgi:hypothetical protein